MTTLEEFGEDVAMGTAIALISKGWALPRVSRETGLAVSKIEKERCMVVAERLQRGESKEDICKTYRVTLTKLREIAKMAGIALKSPRKTGIDSREIKRFERVRDGLQANGIALNDCHGALADRQDGHTMSAVAESYNVDFDTLRDMLYVASKEDLYNQRLNALSQ